jgi:alkylation response protein AidB-like acyl-CoA dehydrogenase
MDFGIDERTEAFRREVRAFLAEHLTDEVRARYAATGSAHDWTLHRAMAQRGWIGAAWPVAEGGQGRDPYEMEILYDELQGAGAPTDGFSMTMVVAESLRRIGTPEQKERLLGPIRAGEMTIAFGYSEPDVGSDLASVSTTAIREGDGWRINGQKAFTTLAHEAAYVYLLARTDPAVAPHRGLTMFLVPTSAPGFSMTPVHTLGGERTNMTFYTDVVVGDDARVGAVDGGWAVVMLALAFERGAEFAPQVRRLVSHASRWAREAGSAGDRRVLARLGRVAADYEVARLLGSRATWLRAADTAGDIEGAMAKLYATEALVRGSRELLGAAGAEGLQQPSAPRAPAGGELEHSYRHAQVTTIYGGTSEILREQIAQRRLGMPRSRQAPVAKPKPAGEARRSGDPGPASAPAPAPAASGRRTWTNVYLSFSLPESDRAALDRMLANRGSSLGQEFHAALHRCLDEAGIDRRGLARPDVDADEHHA